MQTRQNWNNSRKSRLSRRFKRVEKLLETAKPMGITYTLVKMGSSDEDIETQKEAIRKVFKPGVDTLIILDWEE